MLLTAQQLHLNVDVACCVAVSEGEGGGGWLADFT